MSARSGPESRKQVPLKVAASFLAADFRYILTLQTLADNKSAFRLKLRCGQRVRKQALKLHTMSIDFVTLFKTRT